uniref:Uncharacterized protein n=1 Tax=Aegilops tauschii TaxID=37682 RepID=N1R1G6_AEGTA
MEDGKTEVDYDQPASGLEGPRHRQAMQKFVDTDGHNTIETKKTTKQAHADNTNGGQQRHQICGHRDRSSTMASHLLTTVEAEHQVRVGGVSKTRVETEAIL